MVGAAKAGKSILKARQSLANYKIEITALRRPVGTVTPSRKAMEKIIQENYSDLFDNHIRLSSYEMKENGNVVPPVVLSEIRHFISSVKHPTAPCPDTARSKYLKNLPPVLVNTLARLFTRYLS
uniref:Dynamin_M domain-containing protein n=1 Tax=Angiostrongylus cantonensis TaxID=6313 RepID=A0A0K0DL04_ANGCA